MKGVIFDFNGTMFQDSHLHEKAWFFMVKKYAPKTISDDDIFVNIHGRTNSEILTYFISGDLTNEEIKKLSFEKEAYYRELCLENKDELKLTKGLTGVLNHLKKSKTPMTIATATVKENVDFYFDVFHWISGLILTKSRLMTGASPENRRRIFFSSHRKS